MEGIENILLKSHKGLKFVIESKSVCVKAQNSYGHGFKIYLYFIVICGAV